MTRLGRGGVGGARWREQDSVSRGLRRPKKGALQKPAVLAARALAHARSARWRAVFPEQATSARLSGGGACGGRGGLLPSVSLARPAGLGVGDPTAGPLRERSGFEFQTKGCSRARLGVFKKGAERAKIFEGIGDRHWKFVFNFRSEIGRCQFIFRS